MASNVAGVVNLLLALSTHVGYSGISPVPLPDDAFKSSQEPWVTVQEILNTHLTTHDGDSDMGPSIIQVNCWNSDYEKAYEVRFYVDVLLRNYVGTMITMVGAREVVAQGTIFRGFHELYDPERELHQLIVRYTIWFEG